MAHTLIRIAGPGDSAQIAAIYAPFVRDTPTSFELVQPDDKEIKKRIFKTLTKCPWLVCEIAGHITGYAYAGMFRSREAYQWSVEVSVYIHPEFRRRGIGKALYTSLFAMLDRQGFYNVYAGITRPNEASIRFHQSVGFEYIGDYRSVGYKHGRWHDVSWWWLSLRDDRDHPPGAILSPDDLQNDSEWMAAMQSGCVHIK